MNLNDCHGQNIIIAGCGGGYDLFGGLPLFYLLKHIANHIVFTNYSFTSITVLNQYGLQCANNLYLIKPTVLLNLNDNHLNTYFPEAYVAYHLNVDVYALSHPTTIYDLIEAYQIIISNMQYIDKLFLIDGGCDVLLTGKEIGLGTPVIDMMHLKAIQNLNIRSKYILAVGVNIDIADGVDLGDLNQRLTTLKNNGTLINQQLWSLNQPEIRFYRDIVKQSLPQLTIVHSLVVATLEGHRGYYTPPHLISRITISKIDLTDQTCSEYLFDLNQIAKDVEYLDQLESIMNNQQVNNLINKYRQNNSLISKT